MATRSSKHVRLTSGLDSPSNRQSKRATKPSRKRAAADADTSEELNQATANVSTGESSCTRPSTTGQRFAKALERQEARNRAEMQRQELARQAAQIEQDRANQRLLLQRRQAEQALEEAAERDRQEKERQAAEDRRHEKDMNRMLREREEAANDYTYGVIVFLKEQLRNSTRVTWSTRIGEDWKQNEFDVNRLDLELRTAMATRNFQDELVDITAWIKSAHSKAMRQRVSLSALSYDVWTEQVEHTLKSEHRKFNTYPLQVQVECVGRLILDHSTSASVHSSVSEPSSGRRTRTSQQEDQHTARREANEAAGD